jgi:hypothetical protein
MHRGETEVAGAGGVVSVVFEVVQERADRGGVQIGQVQRAGRFPGAGVYEAQQQPDGVPVSQQGVLADPTLVDQPLGEEGLQGRGQRGHVGFSKMACSRSAARANRSGTPVRYQ